MPASALAPATPSRAFRIPYLRWWIGGLLLIASILNYVDRQALSILAPTIQSELAISDVQYGNIVSWFLAAYTVAFLLSGRLVDLVGTRLGLALFVGWWSVANALTGLANSVASLGFFRFLLGLGEAGGYTTSPKVVAEWFPAKERGIAVGLYSVGGALGATIAPLLVIGLAAQFGWRSVFFVTGAFGVLFAVFWFWFFQRPQTHPRLADAERAHIFAGQESAAAIAAAPALSTMQAWQRIFRSPAIWALMFARLLTDPVWYFYQFWMAKYLHAERGFDQKELASMWLIFVAADIGFLISGFISAWFIKRGATPVHSRRRVLLFCAALVPAGALVPLMTTSPAVFAVSMVVVFAHAAWLTALTTYLVDLIPRTILGTAIGFIGAGSALGGIFMNQSVPWVIANYSYAPCFYAMIAVHPLALGLIYRFARQPVVLAA
ncbi:MAG: MFS transporter [Burkholderiales bacterium]|nr:MFS transporter [Opitutaceae bacterium]